MVAEKTLTRAELAEATRANIIEVAAAEFVDKGLAGARIDVIADKTHSSKRMIYYYFGGKDGLYRAVLEQAYAGIRTAERRLDVTDLSATDALKALVEQTFNYHYTHPEFVRLVMNENILHGAHINEIAGLKDRNRAVLATLGEILGKGVVEGVFRDGVDPLQAHMTMTAMCFYNQSNRYTLKAGFDIDLAEDDTRQTRCREVVRAVLAYVSR